MSLETPKRSGRRLGDFSATPNTPNEDIYKESRELLHASRRTQSQSQSRKSTEPIKSEEMATPDPGQARVNFGYGNSSNQTPAPRGYGMQNRNSSNSPFVIDDSPTSTPHAQARVAKRPASPSLMQNGSGKRQQTRHNTPVIMSPSRPLSNGTVDSLFGMDVDQDEHHMGSESREIREGENGLTHGDLYHSASRSVNVGSQTGRRYLSGRSSARQTPSHEYFASSNRQTPSREHPPSNRQTPSREHTSFSQQHQSSSKCHRTPQHIFPQRNHDADPGIAEDPYCQARAVSVSRRHGTQYVQKEIEFEDHNMEIEDEIAPMPLVRAASMMREAIRAQSRPPQRGATAPPESFQDRPLLGEPRSPNGSWVMRSMTPGQQRSVREGDSYSSGYKHIDQKGHTPRQPARHRTPKRDSSPKKFILDTLDGDSESETEETELTSFFRGPKRNQQEPRSRQQSAQPQSQSPFRRANTTAPEMSNSKISRSLVNTPNSLQRLSEADEYAVKSLQLQSPIWAPGADHRVMNLLARSRTPIRDRNGDTNGFHDEQRGRSRSVAPRTPVPTQSRNTNGTHEDHRRTSRSVARRTPTLDRVRSQNHYGSPGRNVRAKSQAYESGRMDVSQTCAQISGNHNPEINGYEEINGPSRISSMAALQRSRRSGTPTQAHQDDDHNAHSPDVFQTPLDVQIRRNQRQAQKVPPIQNVKDNPQKVSSVLPSGSAFAKKAKHEPQKKVGPDPVTPNRVASGRGFKDPEVIDLVTPEGPSRYVSMKERLTPRFKKPAPKQTVAPAVNRAPKSSAQPPKRVAKEKPAPVDTEEVRQKRVAEIIIDRKQKSDEASLDIALFGEIIHDQAAEDKKAEEARAKGQREREAKMNAMIAQEKAAKEATEKEEKHKKVEVERRKREREAEEQQKRIKREADRKRQLAHENREKEILRQAAEEKIRLNREKQAKDEEQRELENQRAKEKAKSVQAQAEEIAKLRAKQEQAKLQAVSLRSAKVPSAADAKTVENLNVLIEDEESLFMPQASLVVLDKAKTDDRSVSKANKSNGVMSQVSNISSYRLEKEAEEMRKNLEQSKIIHEKLGARYNRAPSTMAANSAPVSRIEHLHPRPKPVSRPEPVIEKHATATVPTPAPAVTRPPPPQKDRPAPKPKPKPSLKSKSTRDKIYESFRSQSSSSSGDVTPASSYLERLAANNLFNGIPAGISSFSRTKSKQAGLKPREYKHKAILISDLEREELEKRQQKRSRVRDSRALTEKQKQDAADKRTEKAKEKQIEKIREEAEKNGTELSQEELHVQVEAFMEKRAQDLKKRAEKKAQLEADPGHDFGRNPLDPETLTPAQQLLRDTDNEDGLSAEYLQLRHKHRDDLAAKVAFGKIRNSAFDKASARKTTAHFTDSEESEEDPDPEPEIEVEDGVIQQRQSTEDGVEAEEESSIQDSSTESESDDDDTGLMSPIPEMSAAFTARAAEADREAQRKRVQALNNQACLPGGGPGQRMVHIYQVWKLELTRVDDGEDETNQQMVEQFASLAEANAYASDIVLNNFRTCKYNKLEESYKDNKYRAVIAHDATHESQIFLVEMPVGPSELSAEFLASIPQRIPETFWDVMQFTSKRIVDEETGVASVHHGIPKRCGQFSVLEMANHEACEKLIALFRPVGSNLDHITHYAGVSARARELRDQADADGACFQVEIERDEIAEWMGYENIKMMVECVEIQGPLN
ncbi:hypothetical protein BKA65DRAFT_536745 [Rhexocercosporidium sp. MPI-PUGE-AT-0058]|nr:hypothetical protein BKA65DRAFT_536745 [Rhexocercosporidium sp. MPI-PUGE-AT-0058]